ncbi:hypothetical protein BFJ66_g3564 [Fusarium oxysporum f. sp. cepae]|uniref:BTB domain-containing protein n=1 Tax=Fusarium oxysporum f. sp. cepae TaxID=396571 RepID=A0A3L6NB43_FUSOX|nr:hypothetical protein BFJ65_g13115 [Fusarium oxysporum f. sp. cepae]RKK52336.1 hypothetical protein BFJ67_g5665 [Fusarium oxysporum f. sp. cepae]RKK56658.1 hypothetical protein BFJ66_g3564 [Fusarium oxysporum f. sp. cepae]
MSSESENNVPDEVVIPNGDIILVVGQEKLRIQVSSQFLTLASPVFDAMLNLKFSEGIKLHESNELLVDIKLPEDDGLATAQALKTIYGSDPSMLFLDPDEIQKVSILADKYDMSPSFSMAATDWMNCEPANLDQAWKLMTASYWLNLEDSFRTMSEHVVVKMNHAQIFRLAQQTHDVGLGLKLGMALLLLHHALSQHMAHPKGGQCLCCFKITADDPVGMQPGCPNPSNHLSG